MVRGEYRINLPDRTYNFSNTTITTDITYIDWSGEPSAEKVNHWGWTIGFDYIPTGNVTMTICAICEDGVTRTAQASGAWSEMHIEESKIIGFYFVIEGTGTGTVDIKWLSIFEYYDVIYPTITIGEPSTTKISSISGYDKCTVVFHSDADLQYWEARATTQGQTIGHGSGLLVESGGSLLQYDSATVSVDDEELTNGDVEYTISIFGQSVEGRWSDG